MDGVATKSEQMLLKVEVKSEVQYQSEVGCSASTYMLRHTTALARILDEDRMQ